MGENISEFNCLNLKEKMLVNNLQIKYGYLVFRKFEGENLGHWPSICQCFLPPTFSAIQYD